MLRYVIVLGEQSDVRCTLGPEWSIVLGAPGAHVAVWGPNVEVARSGDGRAVVLGRLHWRGGRVGQHGGCFTLEDVVASAWGRYVAVQMDRGTSWTVLRDPSGRIPCYSARSGAQRLVFSHIEDAIAVGWRNQGPDWATVAAFVQDARMRDGRTGLVGVEELLPGEAIDAKGSKRAFWRPATFVDDVVEDRSAARRMLREAVEQSVQSAAGGKRVLHLLSGGLDSSIVLGCLRQHRHASELSCLTFSQGEGSELDEVRYAQAAADAAGTDLHVAYFAPDEVRLDRTECVIDQPRPSGYVFSIENDDAELSIAEAMQAEVCTSGAGGDGLFFQLRARTYCADYLLNHGPSLGALRVALDNARLSRVSMWRSLREGWRLAYGGGVFNPEAALRNPYLAADQTVPSEGWLRTHPWFSGAHSLPPGKRLHLWAVLECLNLFFPYRRSRVADTELPIVSQPVIETVLRIPSYVLSEGGRDRSLVRDAFADIVPASIIRRTGKGAMDGYYAEVCAANKRYLRERILDGVLVGQKIVRRDELERDLPLRGDPRDGRELYLLQLLAIETWASAWVDTPALSNV